ncbi:MAG: AraC family transcriptional regulator [Kiritimatiellae bacterium]|nr:AraC family transcriptional regulator [Kiritimatiellia bacterium]MDD5519832.1 AraC family transcriptional regulator [Kiritimatiellia bacterium]
MPIPIYQEHGQTYQADTCEPVVQAVKRRRLQMSALARGHYPGRKLDRNALPGLKTIGFWDARSAQDWGLEWHRNEGIELTFLERGNLGFAVDRHTCQLRPDDLTITRPWQRHRVGNPNVASCRLHWFILDVDVRRPHQSWRWPSWIVLTKPDLQELTHILRHTERPVWRATPAIRHCFQSIAKAVESDDSGSNISKLAAYLNELFALVLEMCRYRQVPLDESLSSTQRTVSLFWDDLRQHHEHLAEPWTVGSMARQCGLGITNFIHHTKQLTNTTPILYLNQSRLEMAARLLKESPSRSVLDIALDCGFSSSQYFATLFRHRFGCTPRDFRHAHAGSGGK